MLLLRPLTALTGLISSAAAISISRSFNQTKVNGFPKPDKQQALKIAEQAGGALPGGMLPSNLTNTSITTLQLIAYNELFEVAFFSDLLDNLTTGEKGYETPLNESAIETIRTVRAQEQQHALGAIAVLENNDAFAPSSCKYAVPATNLSTAILIAETFTDVVLGALQGASYNFAMDKHARPLVALFGSIIGQEGEQNGAYRLYGGQVPSSSPFLTPVPASFAWTALQLFTVPGSCPYSLDKVNLTIFPSVTVNGGPIAVVQPKNQTLYLTANLTDWEAGKKYVNGDGKGLYATFTTGYQPPASVAIRNAKWNESIISFEAEFPYETLVAHGFTHVALTNNSNITDAMAVPDYTLAAPGVIQVNNTVMGNMTNKHDKGGKSSQNEDEDDK